VGIFNLGILGILGMIAYIIAGPDGTAKTAPRLAHAPAGA
jgi:hypothetical protein